jgi:arginyl-tRNA synthetase
MTIEQQLSQAVSEALKTLYSVEMPAEQVVLQKTKKEFNGHFTLVVFPFLRASKKSPEQTAQEIGEFLRANRADVVADFNVIKGFLNITVGSNCWVESLNNIHSQLNYGRIEATDESPLVMIEYSSPNTNKPLHLGHIRNNLLGYSLSEVMKANGNKVVKTNIVNDRGIHICKSMLAWQKWGNGATPESTGIKGDHFVGDYYVLFDQNYREELKKLQSEGMSEKEAEAASALMAETRELLRCWEAGDEKVMLLWSRMNSWVYAGFDETYQRLGVDFDKIYYESETYLDGKKKVLECV